jgi:hypothetical protein
VAVASDFNEDDAAAAASASDDVLLDGTVAKQPTPAYNKGLIDFQVFQASNYEKVRIPCKEREIKRLYTACI